MLALLFLPFLAMADDGPRIDAARELAHGHSIHDQVRVGNALAKLQALACSGDVKASALLGRKYFSGLDEFSKNHIKAEPYLRYAAEMGEGASMVDLVLLIAAKPPTGDTLADAEKWLRVATYTLGADAVSPQLAGNSVQILKGQNPELEFDTEQVATAAAIKIHRLRNRLNDPIPTPCQASR